MKALFYQNCIGLEKTDRYCHLVGSEPTQVFQQVFGRTPSQQELDSLIQNHNAVDPSSGKPYIDMDTASAANFLKNTPQYQQQQAQTAQTNYQSAVGSAVSTMKGAGADLDTQYKSLLQDVLGQGTVALNTATTGENNLLASRGITNNSPLYSREMASAQLPVTAQNQAAVGNLGYTEGQLQTGLASNIANLQAGGAGTAAELPLSYGSLALAGAANVANIALANAQTKGAQTGARYVTTPYGLYDVQSNQYVTGAGTLPTGGQVVNQNGQYYLSVP